LNIVPENPDPEDELTQLSLVRRYNNHFDALHLPEPEDESESSSSSDDHQSSHSSAEDSSNDEDDLFDGTEWEENHNAGM
jgi:hypothetical protein